ncbi:MAG: hypothetical protein ABSG91_07035 [Syntrophobacteraceae bacterium]|jgi:membrane protein involved in colicin uptake
MSKSTSPDDAKWKAEQDAHTLADAHAIMKDSARHKAAQEAAKNLKDDTEKQAKQANDHNDAMQMLASKMYPTMQGEPSDGTSQ